MRPPIAKAIHATTKAKTPANPRLVARLRKLGRNHGPNPLLAAFDVGLGAGLINSTHGTLWAGIGEGWKEDLLREIHRVRDGARELKSYIDSASYIEIMRVSANMVTEWGSQYGSAEHAEQVGRHIDDRKEVAAPLMWRSRGTLAEGEARKFFAIKEDGANGRATVIVGPNRCF